MKAEPPVTGQVAALSVRNAAPVATVAAPQQGEALKFAQTTRPVVDAQAAHNGGLRSRDGGPRGDAPQLAGALKTKLEFSVDEPSGRMVVSIVDQGTAEILRQIPAEDMLAIARQIEEKLRDSGVTEGLFVTNEA